ncbi:MAG: hypothetical protein ACYC6X_00260 [Minisyncoccota bacterium]
MKNTLTALIQLARTTGRFTEEKAHELNIRPWVLSLIAFTMCSAGLAANVLGYKWPSLALAIVYMVIITYHWWELSQLGIVAAVGLAAGSVTRRSHEKSVEVAFKLWMTFYLWVLLVPGTFLLIMGNFLIRKEDIQLILDAIVGISIFEIIVTMWPEVFPGNMGKKAVYYYSIAVIVLSLGGLASGGLGALMVKYTGLDPATIKPTDTEDALYHMDRTKTKVADKDRAAELNRITKKIEGHKTLTQVEKQFIDEARQSQSSKKSPTPRAPSCPAFSPDEIPRSCVVDTNWSNWVGISVPTYRDQYKYCLSTGPYKIQYKLSADSPPMDWHPGELINPMYMRFKTTDGTYRVKYELAESCPIEL